MARLQVRSFAASGRVRRFRNGYTNVLPLDETVVGYGVYEPRFRWSADVRDLAGEPTCPLHLGAVWGGDG